jgi:hypothetical protein
LLKKLLKRSTRKNTSLPDVNGKDNKLLGAGQKWEERTEI